MIITSPPPPLQESGRIITRALQLAAKKLSPTTLKTVRGIDQELNSAWKTLGEHDPERIGAWVGAAHRGILRDGVTLIPTDDVDGRVQNVRAAESALEQCKVRCATAREIEFKCLQELDAPARALLHDAIAVLAYYLENPPSFELSNPFVLWGVPLDQKGIFISALRREHEHLTWELSIWRRMEPLDAYQWLVRGGVVPNRQ